jgi:hypothetical protein
MKTLLIQENGRHEANRHYRECFCLQRALEHHGYEADVWGLGHDNYVSGEPDYEAYDLVINLENYDETGWVPSLSKVQTKKFLWSIDAHCRGIDVYTQTANEGNYDLILEATPEFLTENSIWFPNCYEDVLIKPLDIDPIYDVGFCGNVVNRGQILQTVAQNFNFKFDNFVIGDAMVEAVNSYKIHFNANISLDINYRNFETMGCETLLLTSYNKHYEKLGLKDGENCLVYSSVEELIEKGEMALGDEELRNRIAKNGYDIVKEKHTFKQRAKTVLDILNGTYDEQSI